MKTPLEILMLKTEVIAATVGSVVAIISPDQHLSIMGWSLLGGILGGFVGAYLSQPKNYKQYILRWAVNIAASLVVGIGVISYIEPSLADHPVQFIALAISAIGGPLMVLALPIGIPILWGIVKEAAVSFVNGIVEKYIKKNKQ